MSEEKVLFEMRISRQQDGVHISIKTSLEWRAYHARQRGPQRWKQWRTHHRARVQEDLRRAYDTLQNIYDDLYQSPAVSEL